MTFSFASTLASRFHKQDEDENPINDGGCDCQSQWWKPGQHSASLQAQLVMAIDEIRTHFLTLNKYTAS